MTPYNDPNARTRHPDAISDSGADPDTEEIRIEIEQTRAEMSGTLNAIQDRLAPEVLSAQAKDVAHDVTEQAKEKASELLEQAVHDVKEAAKEVTANAVHEVKDAAREMTGHAKDAAWDATVGRVESAGASATHAAKGIGATMIETIKQNPLPAALAGIGLAWLFMNRSSGQHNYGNGNYASRYPAPVGEYGSHARYGSQTYYMTEQDPARQTTQSESSQGVTGKISGAASQAGEMAGNAASSAREMASDLASTASDLAGNVASGASTVASSATHMAGTAGERALDAGGTLFDLIRQNPIPASLIGAGLTWMAYNSSSSQSSSSYQPYSYSARTSGTYPQASRYRSTTPFESSSDWQGPSRAGQYSTAQRHETEDKGMLQGATEQAREYAGQVQEHASDLASTAWDTTRQAPSQIQRMVEDNPLMTAALAATVGAAVGLMLPNTQREDQLLGQARDSVMGQAREMGRDAMDKVQNIASEAQHTATREARAQGLQV